MDIDYEKFDLEEYLEDRNLLISTSGGHTTKGYVNTSCPFCGSVKDHLGINLQSMLFHCWYCGAKGHITKFVSEVEGGISYTESNTIISRYIKDFSAKEYTGIGNGEKIEAGGRSARILQEFCLGDFPKMYLDYLKGRNFDPDTIIPKYDLRAGGPLGKYKHRIICPTYFRGKIVNFTARDITGKSKQRYLHPSNDEVLISTKQLLYNFDTVKDRAIIVEGVTDVWRIGDGAVALMGKVLSSTQFDLLKGLEMVSIMLDGGEDERKTSKAIAVRLKLLVPTVKIIDLEDGQDPAALSAEEINVVRGELGLD